MCLGRGNLRDRGHHTYRHRSVADTHIVIAMAIGNNENQPLSKLLIPKPMIINYVIIDEHCFSDRLFINGYGSFTENGEADEKTSNNNNESIKLQQGEDSDSEFIQPDTVLPYIGK